MQDATAQMALLQFMTCGRQTVAVPSTVHCDHLIQAKVGAKKDLQLAIETNREVYDFLGSISDKYGMVSGKPVRYHSPGSIGKLCISGGMMIGTDSHTPNAGGLGMIAIGVVALMQ
jgi:aconitate hydratase